MLSFQSLDVGISTNSTTPGAPSFARFDPIAGAKFETAGKVVVVAELPVPLHQSKSLQVLRWKPGDPVRLWRG